MATGTGLRVAEIAQDLFEVVTQIGLSTLRGRRRVADLKEVEFLTLSILHTRECMIVGDIQRLLGVLPAQMSRIIRALESRDRPLIACRINSRDKRKIGRGSAPAHTLLRPNPGGQRTIQATLPDDAQRSQCGNASPWTLPATVRTLPQVCPPTDGHGRIYAGPPHHD